MGKTLHAHAGHGFGGLWLFEFITPSPPRPERKLTFCKILIPLLIFDRATALEMFAFIATSIN